VYHLPDGNSLLGGRWPPVELHEFCGELAGRVDLPK
jgi:hypothetical protein